MMKPLKALILGDGNMAQVHKAAYAKCGVEVVEDRPDIVSICTPDYLHGQQVIDALNAGCHVMCEKPLCTETEELDQIETLAGELKLCVNYPLRHHPPFANLDRNPTSFHVSYFYGRKHKLVLGWRAHKDYSAVMGGMIHMIDLVCFRTGQEMTMTGAYSAKGYTTATVMLKDGTAGSVSCDFSEHEGHHHYVDWSGTLRIASMVATNKQREIVNFVTHLRSVDKLYAWSNDSYFHPTRTCLEIDAAC